MSATPTSSRLPAAPQGISRLTWAGLLMTVGIVFGDIGTSPLYVMKAITAVNPHFSADYIIGAISCVIWTLTLQTTVKYVVLALRADNNGEGGILALFSLLRKLKRHKRLFIAAAIGAAALIADGVITPAITVTSAIEGLDMIASDVPVNMITVVIIVLIFMMQQAGTGKIGRLFGPFMLVWFLTLGITGAFSLTHYPAILKAFNPWYAVRLLVSSPEWFLILGAVFLCTTGAEALYSDLGHCGRRNISVAWLFVKIMLILNYLGQGAWLLGGHYRPGMNPFYSSMPGWMLLPGVILATCAAIIASQALLSGSFTIFSEAMSLTFWPRMRIKYPSREKGQLYIPAVNWALLVGCLLTVWLFRDSAHMEGAYGLAITITMLMTTLLLAFWMHAKGVRKVWCAVFFAIFTTIEGLFLIANLTKFTHGGWYTLLIGGALAAAMVVWRQSSRMRSAHIEYRDLAGSLPLIDAIANDEQIPRTASNLVYLSRSNDPDLIETKLIYSIVNRQPKRADHYWLVHLEYSDSPDELRYTVREPLPGRVYLVTMHIGFRVAPSISLYLRQIVEDLTASKRLDLRSPYPSLRRAGRPGDFRFIIIHRLFSAESRCSRREAMLLRLHDRLRRLGIADHVALGLDTSSITFETVPLILVTTPGRRISPS